MMLSLFFSFFFFLMIFIGKVDLQRGGETQRKIIRLMSHSPSSGNGWSSPSLKPGASSSSRSPTQVQGPNALGHPHLLYQANSTKLNEKHGSQD